MPACAPWRRRTCSTSAQPDPRIEIPVHHVGEQVSPRGATALLATSRAWAWLSGRGYVTPDDVKALAHPTLRHRVQLRPEAELEGVSTESVLDTVLASVAVPR